ncbi:hypothetical protein DRN73_02565 [Candidatus Pacearchaeota archaeon]|nr:MAG: hypothetical protein DRN73_02565 [Candidatus Pacearchaeota archaeon]
MEGVIIFDASSLISLSMNGLFDEIRKLKKIFQGKFIIPKEVKYEVIDRPLNVKRFELEALRIKELLDDRVLEMPDSLGIKNEEISKLKDKMLKIANSMFEGNKKDIKIIQDGETACLALSRMLFDKKIPHVIAVDERTTRMLGEKPENLEKLLTKKLSTRVKLKKKNFKYFRGFRFIRSTELIYVAWKKGLIDLKDGKTVLDALLWALKFKGCAISGDEIKEIKAMK